MFHRERLIFAIPSGPQVPGDPRHSEGSRLAEPTHNFLQRGLNLRYIMRERQLYSRVRNPPIEIAEFRGSDIPKVVAEGRAQVGITGLDRVLNLSDEDLYHVEVLRKLHYGVCNFQLGVPDGYGYSPNTRLEDVKSKIVAGDLPVVATALPILARRKFRERGIAVQIFPMDGHVENAIRYRMADAIMDITETGNTMRKNKIIPAECLEPIEAVLIGSRWPLDKGRKRVLRSLLDRVDKALEHPETWLASADNESNRIPTSNERYGFREVLSSVIAANVIGKYFLH